MAHEIEIVKGQASMAYAGEVPWHGLGVRVDDTISTVEMMKAAGLNWKVNEVPTFANVPMADGSTLAVPTGMKALIRETDNRVLTQVGSGWHPVQNEEAFDFFREFIEAGDMKMHTAGSLKNGEIIWALAKVDDSFELFSGDKVESYLLFSNPHQYGKTINIRFTPIRVVCNNTLTLSLRESATNGVRLNHRRAFDGEEVKRTMGIAKTKLVQYKEMATFLGSKRTTADTVKEYFGHLLGTSAKDSNKLSRTGERAMELLETQPGAQFAAGTWWSAFNAITFMTDHELGRTADSRLASAWYGENAKLKTQALEKALEMAG